jgi:hypothetical protein
MRRVVLFMCAMFMLPALQACGADAKEMKIIGDNELQLVSERVDETGFRIVAFRGDAMATIIVSRGALREEGVEGNPDIDGPYRFDLILRNRYGFPFLTSGMHGVPTDPDLGTMSLVPNASFHKDEQRDDVVLITDALNQIASQQLGEDFRWEVRSLQSLVGHAIAALEAVPASHDSAETPLEMPAEFRGIVETDALDEAVVTPPSADGIGVVRQALGSTFTHKVYIKKGPCFFCGDTGEHSAVLLDVYYDGGSYIGSVSTQNHGREATDGSMSTAYNCPKTYTGRSVAFPNFQPYISTDYWLGIYGDAGGCGTSYGLTSGKHVCNDDSLAQYYNIKYNTTASWSFCGDSSLAYWAPYCN